MGRLALSPRTRNLLVSSSLLLVMVIGGRYLPMPYVIESPGPTRDVLGEVDGQPVISVSKAPTYPTNGQLDLTTLTQTRPGTRLDLPSAYGAWFDRDRILLPRRLVYPDGLTAEDVRQENAILLDRSQESARAAALRHLGFQVPRRVVVDRLTQGGPATGHLDVGDVIVAVDDARTATADDVRVAVRRAKPGDEVVVTVRRDGVERVVTITTGALDENPDVAFLGIVPAAGYDFPVDIGIHIDERIGGPSAGLVFAIGIVDRMTRGALLDGMHVAGTGTIDDEGTVGPIGGIQQKIAAARKAGAAIFLVPEDNCRDIDGARPGETRLVKVTSLTDALQAIEAAAADSDAELPTC